MSNQNQKFQQTSFLSRLPEGEVPAILHAHVGGETVLIAPEIAPGQPSVQEVGKMALDVAASAQPIPVIHTKLTVTYDQVPAPWNQIVGSPGEELDLVTGMDTPPELKPNINDAGITYQPSVVVPRLRR